MQMNYETSASVVIKRLETAHNPKIAKVRAKFFDGERAFFRRKLNGKKILVAGAGLGHDSFELAGHNLQVVGVEMLGPLVTIARKKSLEKKILNVEFHTGDFSKRMRVGKFDAAVLNMGTISDFENKENVLNRLVEIAPVVYFDFYPPSQKNLLLRKRMYQEEQWQDVRVENNAIRSSDGLWSSSLSKQEVREIVRSFGADVMFYKICDFSVMAEVKR